MKIPLLDCFNFKMIKINLIDSYCDRKSKSVESLLIKTENNTKGNRYKENIQRKQLAKLVIEGKANMNTFWQLGREQEMCDQRTKKVKRNHGVIKEKLE